jgi:hypothetical protein
MTIRIFWMKEGWLKRKRMRVVVCGNDDSCWVEIGAQEGYVDTDDAIAKNIFTELDSFIGGLKQA